MHRDMLLCALCSVGHAERAVWARRLALRPHVWLLQRLVPRDALYRVQAALDAVLISVSRGSRVESERQ